MMRPSRVAVTTGLTLNMASSIGIVLINKHIYVSYGYPSMSLTLIHFIITSICLKICSMLEIFRPKRIPILKVVPLALSFCGFVVFTNLSLQFNTVGTYQLIKSMTTPVIMFLQYFIYSKNVSTSTMFTVIPVMMGMNLLFLPCPQIPVMMGIFVNSYYDVQFNLVGMVFAGIGVMITSIYQIWVGAKQHEFAANSMQLLYYQAPLASLMLLCMVLVWEPVQAASLTKMPVDGILWVLGSGLAAFMVNLSIFWVIGKTSPLTYNMVGHFKLCLTILGGYFLFNDTFNIHQILGISCTLCGIFLYSYAKLSEQDLILDPIISPSRHRFPRLELSTDCGPAIARRR